MMTVNRPLPSSSVVMVALTLFSNGRTFFNICQERRIRVSGFFLVGFCFASHGQRSSFSAFIFLIRLSVLFIYTLSIFQVANTAIISVLTIHCSRWEGVTRKLRWHADIAEAKKMKSHTLHIPSSRHVRTLGKSFTYSCL